MFIVGGFNCHPAEIGRLFAAHPAIGQVARACVPIVAGMRRGAADARSHRLAMFSKAGVASFVLLAIARVALLPGPFVREGAGRMRCCRGSCRRSLQRA
ncbi:hypothetical protein [Burkholderia sp. BCC0419]|uniref:hypothetical protein n=1 Tax=Burkholderia sp. BCC0419 TaxID=486878 RepID=UPI00158E00F8|nr:hypothetical protein [Burkholderia sp. BCC0419]